MEREKQDKSEVGLPPENRGKGPDKREVQALLEDLMGWVDERISLGDVPRFADVVEFARGDKRFARLPAAAVRKRLRLHPNYEFNAAQQRARKRSNRNRSIVANMLGTLHADIGYYGRSSEYETPRTYRAGFLVARDLLSRYVYAVPLHGSKSAAALVTAFVTLFKKHEQVFGKDGHRIHSVGFDKERAVMSKEVRALFEERGVKLHAFAFSSSKAKQAENAIKQIRTTMDRLKRSRDEKRWWRLLEPTVEALNSRPLIVQGRRLGFAPRDVNSGNLKTFLATLYKKVPHVYWAQFDVNPDLVNFRFEVGNLVRPKLIAVSSAVLGTKRSEVALDETVFVIEKRVPYLTTGLHIGRAYRCRRLDRPREVEVFDEDDVALTADAEQPTK